MSEEEGYLPMKKVKDATHTKEPYKVLTKSLHENGIWYRVGDEIMLDKDEAAKWLTRNAVEKVVAKVKAKRKAKKAESDE